MIVLDTNIFIYLANGTLKAEALNESDIAYASITKVEALGYAKITGEEQSYLEALLDACDQIELDQSVIQQAIRLRQQSKMSLGDAIVAASALVHSYELWTANVEDFMHIEDLRLHNPLH